MTLRHSSFQFDFFLAFLECILKVATSIGDRCCSGCCLVSRLQYNHLLRLLCCFGLAYFLCAKTLAALFFRALRPGQEMRNFLAQTRNLWDSKFLVNQLLFSTRSNQFMGCAILVIFFSWPATYLFFLPTTFSRYVISTRIHSRTATLPSKTHASSTNGEPPDLITSTF